MQYKVCPIAPPYYPVLEENGSAALHELFTEGDAYTYTWALLSLESRPAAVAIEHPSGVRSCQTMFRVSPYSASSDEASVQLWKLAFRSPRQT
ncbi:hypothetical protein TWF679_002380 [Orbilia oligospora]|uniref:Uncharacterized protein n=1 Tax=Orbilia oligospora TaxID=2813651 RepID=A0A8H8UTR2_ORBOL|nr:hypothetical protein TWF679_002380 [Orbilia oligospora]